jgi:hypothetical protein
MPYGAETAVDRDHVDRTLLAACICVQLDFVAVRIAVLVEPACICAPAGAVAPRRVPSHDDSAVVQQGEAGRLRVARAVLIAIGLCVDQELVGNRGSVRGDDAAKHAPAIIVLPVGIPDHEQVAVRQQGRGRPLLIEDGTSRNLELSPKRAIGVELAAKHT